MGLKKLSLGLLTASILLGGMGCETQKASPPTRKVKKERIPKPVSKPASKVHPSMPAIVIGNIDSNVSEYGWIRSTEHAFFFAYRSVQTECADPQLNRCYPWHVLVGTLHPKHPRFKDLTLVEADVPSEIRILDMDADQSRLLILWAQGIYPDEMPRLYAEIVDEKGQSSEPILVHESWEARPRDAQVAAMTRGDFIICWQGPPEHPISSISAMRDLRIWCGKVTDQGELNHRFDVSADLELDRRNGLQLEWGPLGACLAWVRKNRVETRLIREDFTLQSPIKNFPQALDHSIELRSGHQGFLLFGLDLKGRPWVQGLDQSCKPKAKAIFLPNELPLFEKPDGMAEIPQGFMLSFRKDKQSLLVGIPKDAKAAYVLKRNHPKSRIFFGPKSAIHVYDQKKPIRFSWRWASDLLNP